MASRRPSRTTVLGQQDREQSATAKRNMDSKIKHSLQVVILDSQGCN